MSGFSRYRNEDIEQFVHNVGALFCLKLFRSYRLADEDMNNDSFWNKFGKYFMELLKIIEKDLIDAGCQFTLHLVTLIVIATGEKWVNHKKYLDEFLNSWTSHSPPLISLRTDTGNRSFIQMNE